MLSAGEPVCTVRKSPGPLRPDIELPAGPGLARHAPVERVEGVDAMAIQVKRRPLGAAASLNDRDNIALCALYTYIGNKRPKLDTGLEESFLTHTYPLPNE
jgi:hypothetical protein